MWAPCLTSNFPYAALPWSSEKCHWFLLVPRPFLPCPWTKPHKIIISYRTFLPGSHCIDTTLSDLAHLPSLHDCWSADLLKQLAVTSLCTYYLVCLTLGMTNNLLKDDYKEINSLARSWKSISLISMKFHALKMRFLKFAKSLLFFMQVLIRWL